MDLQDLFFSLTEGWLKRHLWLGTGQGVFTTWHVFNSHMQWHRAAYQQSSRFTYTNMHTWILLICLTGPYSCYLEEWFFWVACMFVWVCLRVNALVWLCHPYVALFASANKWPHPIMSFRSQMPSNKLLISHLFMHSFSPLKPSPLTSLPDTHSERAQGRPRRT